MLDNESQAHAKLRYARRQCRVNWQKPQVTQRGEIRRKSFLSNRNGDARNR